MMMSKNKRLLINMNYQKQKASYYYKTNIVGEESDSCTCVAANLFRDNEGAHVPRSLTLSCYHRYSTINCFKLKYLKTIH